LYPAALMGQAGRSSILGTVADQSGSAIAGASVTVTNLGTGMGRTVLTNERGDYEVWALDVGVYEVSAEMPGFRKAVSAGLNLEIDQRARANLTLQVGEVTEQITVEGGAPLVQTDDATLSTRIDEAKIRELPIAGDRNLYRLALLAPGMSRGPASSVTTGSLGVGFGIAAMGQKVHNNMVILDGAPIRQSTWSILRMRPSVEALQEFRVESGWYSAEYGTQSGAQIVSTIRPGTNQFHGVAFHFIRNDKLDARNFFEDPRTPKRPLRRNTFGGVVSGPIMRNKSFFTANIEILRERRSSQGFAIYPTERMRHGDLTEPFFTRAGGGLIPVFDTATQQPFPNNQIPASRISPQARAFFQFWPLPNFGSALFNGLNNFAGSTRTALNDHQAFVRIDHSLTARDHLFGRYGWQNVDLTTKPVNPHPYFVTGNPKHQQNATINWKRIVKPTILNEFRISYNRDIFKISDAVLETGFNVLRDLGIPGQTNDPNNTGVPGISVTGLSGVGNTSILRVWDELRQVGDSMAFTRGNHSVKIGSDWTHVRVDFQNPNFLSGNFSFTGLHSGLGLASAERGALGWADFLLDQPELVLLGNVQQSVPGFDSGSFARVRNWRWHSYITDDWRVTPDLTLNIGLRYEFNSVWQDIRGGSRNLDFITGLLFPEPGVKADLHRPDRDNFAPRVGVAWRPFGGTGTVVRLGYGLFYNVNMVNAIAPQLALNPPFSSNVRELNPVGNPRIRMSNADQAATIVGRGELLGIPLDYGVGDVHQWNINIQRSIGRSTSFEIGYVGSKSSHFDRPRTFNSIPLGQTQRPRPELGAVEFLTLDASGTYHGMLAKFERRLASGFTFLQTYTWSHTLFDSLACCGAQRHNNPLDLKSEKGNAETDQRHRSTSAWLYELPWYRGRRGVQGFLLANWQVNGVLVLESGLPIHPTQSLAPVNDGCPRCTRRPDRLRDGNLPADERTLHRWFDTGAFALALGHYGSSGRNILRAPGLVNLDFSLFKNFPITESKLLQFRWEMYNATNTPPFNPPTLDISSGNFGRITSAGLGREMQFGVRFQF
jgi:hypothetical protein